MQIKRTQSKKNIDPLCTYPFVRIAIVRLGKRHREVEAQCHDQKRSSVSNEALVSALRLVAEEFELDAVA